MERFNYEFNNGLQMAIVLGEDGYKVNLSGGNLEQPLMGTFTDFEKMLKQIAPIVHDNAQDVFDFSIFSAGLWTNFSKSTTLTFEETSDILIKNRCFKK